MVKHTHPDGFTGKKMTYEEQYDLWPVIFGRSKRKVPLVGIDVIYDLSRRSKQAVVEQLGWDINEPWRKSTNIKTDIPALIPNVWEILNDNIEGLTPELVLANRLPSGKKLTRELCAWSSEKEKGPVWRALLEAISTDTGYSSSVHPVDVSSRLYTYIVSLRADNEVTLSFEFKDMIAGSFDPNLTWGSCFKNSQDAINISCAPQMGIISAHREGKITGRAWVYIAPDLHYITVYKPYGDLTVGVAHSVASYIASTINPDEKWAVLTRDNMNALDRNLNVRWPFSMSSSYSTLWYRDPQVVHAITQSKITSLIVQESKRNSKSYAIKIIDKYPESAAVRAPCVVCGNARVDGHGRTNSSIVCDKCVIPADVKCKHCGKSADHDTMQLCLACVADGFTECDVCGTPHKSDSTCPLCDARVHCNYCGAECTTTPHAYINRRTGAASLDKPAGCASVVACKDCYNKLCNHVCDCCGVPIDVVDEDDTTVYACNNKILCGKCASFFTNTSVVDMCLDSALEFGVEVSDEVKSRIDFGIKYLGLTYTGFNKESGVDKLIAEEKANSRYRVSRDAAYAEMMNIAQQVILR